VCLAALAAAQHGKVARLLLRAPVNATPPSCLAAPRCKVLAQQPGYPVTESGFAVRRCRLASNPCAMAA
jgi:hypothetical protein